MNVRNRGSALLSSLLALSLCSALMPARAESIGAALTSTEMRQLQREARLVVDLLQNFHYSGRSFREIENKEMVARFLEELDPGGYFLSADDVEFMHRRFDRSLKTVYLLRGDLQPAFEIFDLFATRARERLDWIDRRLAGGFDFSLDEDYVPEKKSDPPRETLPADRRWELWLKEQVLEEILSGRDTPAALAAVGRRYGEMRRQIAAVDALAVRERFFDSLIRSFDPHSGYFSADSAREFAVGMENAVAGIGLDLRKENGLCVVTSVQPGGPADLQSDIQVGDIIDELGDGEAPALDASRRPLRELVALIRGQPGTKLKIAYHPAGTSQHQSVTLERTRVLLGEERAHGAISLVPDNTGGTRRIGWIVLPTFYAAGEKSSATSATRDVRDLLDQMAATNKGIDGLVLDLRNNPGGALTEAVALSGLFLRQGRVMLVRGLDGSVTELAINKDNQPAFSGPLVVLTSPRSASASEIFAGAMQAHRCALIVGGTATFGKGTVQNYIELAKAQLGVSAQEAADWGTLRLTAQRFYLPDGRSVQRAGVASDIVLPAAEAGPAPAERETDLPHALAAETIAPPGNTFAPGAVHPVVSEPLQHRLREQAETDLRSLPEWRLWHEEQSARQAVQERGKFTLVLAARRREWDKDRAEDVARLRARRQLAAQAAFVTEPLEIALLQPALAAHEARLRAAKGDDGQPLLHHLHHGLFAVETDRGRLRRLRLEAVEFREFSGDAAELAEAFSTGAGSAATPEEIGLVLQDLDLLEHKTDEAVLACFSQRIAGGKLEKPAVTHGAEALFDRAATIDGEMLRERPAVDVPLRECLRLAAEWAAGPTAGN